ncbi:hypothetical protein BD779DRAFT_1465896 [Infundibulicybe gibba]|nr:hypothetical protein BD779DRAFT_1465896 [Infundibulicybe gibba]
MHAFSFAHPLLPTSPPLLLLTTHFLYLARSLASSLHVLRFMTGAVNNYITRKKVREKASITWNKLMPNGYPTLVQLAVGSASLTLLWPSIQTPRILQFTMGSTAVYRDRHGRRRETEERAGVNENQIVASLPAFSACPALAPRRTYPQESPHLHGCTWLHPTNALTEERQDRMLYQRTMDNDSGWCNLGTWGGSASHDARG